MRKLISLILAATMFISVVTFAGCGNKEETPQGGQSNQTSSNYQGQTFMLGNWEVTTTNDYVKFDDYYKCDTFILCCTAVNKGTVDAAYNGTANVIAYQNDENLDWSQLQDGNGEFVANTTVGGTSIAPGESVDLVYGWQLLDGSTLTVNFGGYTVDVEDTVLTFEMADRLTEEGKAAAQAAKEELEQKENAKDFDISMAKGTFAKGWMRDNFEDDTIKIIQKEGSPQGYLDITTTTSYDNLKDWANFYKKSYKDAKLSNKKIGKTEYILLPINDTQFMLFGEASEGYVRIFGMFVSLKDAMPQLQKIELK